MQKEPLTSFQLNQKMSANQAGNRVATAGIPPNNSNGDEHNVDSLRSRKVPTTSVPGFLKVGPRTDPIDFQRFFRYRTTQEECLEL